MQSIQVRKSQLSGTLQLPPSKSQTHRAILFALLSQGKSQIHNYLKSPDTTALLNACQVLGAKIHQNNSTLEISGVNGKINASQPLIDIGNSGIALRFLSTISALGQQEVILTGDESIQRRPMQPLLDALEGILQSENGHAPITIKGPIKSGKVSVNGNDSQHVSALLIAAPFVKGGLEISVINPGEMPWIEMTIDWLDRLGIQYQREGYTWFQVDGLQSIQGFTYTVPGDLSSAAFPLTAALATRSTLSLQNVNLKDPQGDKQLFSVLNNMGARIQSSHDTLSVTPGALIGQSININPMIDTITVLAVIGCCAEGETVITNAEIARTKECDRISIVCKELRKMGAHIHERQDGLIIQKSKLIGTTVDSHHDHRMAMALTVAGMIAEGETLITNTACIQKTFPNFVEEFQQLGADMEYIL